MVLGGWLGCQPRSLRRYEALYQSFGFEVVSFIAPPRLVVDATFRSKPIQIPDQWPAELSEQPDSMQELAWKVLGRIHNKQSSLYLFHAFSNGGCFLWENLRRILDSSETCQQQPTKDILKNLTWRTKGVVFDSCPAWYGGPSSPLKDALGHCTRTEKLDVLMRFGPGVFLKGGFERDRRIQRCHEYLKYLYEDPLDIPQLYACSQNDQLSEFERIDELFRHRRSKQKSPVLQHVWEDSPHCAHLLKHPEEYKQAIEVFTEIALLRSKL